jgi:hypothetical protein
MPPSDPEPTSKPGICLIYVKVTAAFLSYGSKFNRRL